MLPEITDASCAAMGGPVLPLEITRRTVRAVSCARQGRSPATAAGVQGANIDARARQLRAGAWMLPEITDASCAAWMPPAAA